MIIDVHGHITAPNELSQYKAGLLFSRGAHGRPRLNISDERLESVLQASADRSQASFGGISHLEHLRQAGTDMQLISPRPFSALSHEKPERIVHWWTEETNDLIARQCRMHPDLFRGVAGLPQNMGVSPKNSLDELGRCVKEHGMIGCLINPDPNEGLTPAPPGLGDEYWYPLYEKLVELDVPALVHSAGCVSERETYTLHFITEETIAIMSLLTSRVFEDFPTLKLIISHGGGAIPYQAGRYRSMWMRERGERFEEALRKLYFDTALYSKDALELLIRTVGPDRCMFGTEKPGTGSTMNPDTGRFFDDLKPLIDSIDWLSDADRAKIYEGNAREVYRLEVPATAAA